MNKTTTQEIERLYEQHSHGLYERLCFLVQDRDVADDLLQDTFVRVVRAYPTLQDTSRVCGWIFTIANHLAYDYLRHKQLIHWQSLEPLQDSCAIEDSQAHVAEQDALSRALQSLPEHYRTALLMDAQGIKQCDLAIELGWTIGKTHMVMARARRALRDEYLSKEVA